MCCLLSTAFVGCSTLGPDPSIHINGDSRLTWSDVREMERVLASLGVRYAITEITMGGHDRVEVYCETRHAVFNPPSLDGGDGIEVTLVRRGGRWVVVGPPRKSGRVILCASIGLTNRWSQTLAALTPRKKVMKSSAFQSTPAPASGS